MFLDKKTMFKVWFNPCVKLDDLLRNLAQYATISLHIPVIIPCKISFSFTHITSYVLVQYYICDRHGYLRFMNMHHLMSL